MTPPPSPTTSEKKPTPADHRNDSRLCWRCRDTRLGKHLATEQRPTQRVENVALPAGQLDVCVLPAVGFTAGAADRDERRQRAQTFAQFVGFRTGTGGGEQITIEVA